MSTESLFYFYKTERILKENFMKSEQTKKLIIKLRVVGKFTYNGKSRVYIIRTL